MFLHARFRTATITPILVGALALVGVFATAAPAHAAVETPQVLTPVEDSKSLTRTVEIAGIGIPTAVITVGGVAGAPAPPVESVTVDADGTWETSATYSPGDFAVQSVSVTQTLDGEVSLAVERRFQIPDPELIFVDSPADGAVVDTRNPVLTGRAPENTSITVTVDGEDIGGSVSGPGGVFTLPLYLGQGDARTADILLQGTYDGQPVQTVTHNLRIPASLPAPVLTSPTGTVDAGKLVFTGTATPGYFVIYNFIDTGAEGQGNDALFGALVGADGTWTSTTEVPAGSYRGNAALSRSINGEWYDDSGFESRALEFTFNARAPAAAATSRTPQLPATGASATEITGAIAGALFLLGTALLTVRRRRARI